MKSNDGFRRKPIELAIKRDKLYELHQLMQNYAFETSNNSSDYFLSTHKNPENNEIKDVFLKQLVERHKNIGSIQTITYIYFTELDEVSKSLHDNHVLFYAELHKVDKTNLTKLIQKIDSILFDFDQQILNIARALF